MRQVVITYNSGNTVRVNYIDNVDVKYKGDKVTAVNIDGAVGGSHPLFWGFENVESIVVESIGWQRVFEYVDRLPIRFWNMIRSKT